MEVKVTVRSPTRSSTRSGEVSTGNFRFSTQRHFLPSAADLSTEILPDLSHNVGRHRGIGQFIRSTFMESLLRHQAL